MSFRKLVSLVFAFVICCSVFYGCDSDSAQNKTKEQNNANESAMNSSITTTEGTEPPTELPVVYEYDSLQTIFLSFTHDTTVEELDALIADNGLCYTRKEYNKSGGGKSVGYKIAYTDGAAKQSHADSGDYIKVFFDKESGMLMTAQYVKSGTVGSALLYCFGTWFDFRDSNAEDYSGYYLIDSLSKEVGITIKYDNGYEVETNYFAYDSAEELIQHIINLEE